MQDIVCLRLWHLRPVRPHSQEHSKGATLSFSCLHSAQPSASCWLHRTPAMRGCLGSLCRDGLAQGRCRRRRRHSTSAATAQPETASLCRLPPAPIGSLQVSSHTSTPGCLLSGRMYNALSTSSRRHAVFARGQFPKDIRQRRSFVRRARTFLRRARTVLHTHVCRPDMDAEHASRQQAAGRGRCRPSVAWHAHPRRRVPLCLARRRPPHLSGAQPRMTCAGQPNGIMVLQRTCIVLRQRLY